MPRKQIVGVKRAAPNPNLSLATRFGNLVFVAGQDHGGCHAELARAARRDHRTACIPDSPAR
jgi:hypothetical protein